MSSVDMTLLLSHTLSDTVFRTSVAHWTRLGRLRPLPLAHNNHECATKVSARFKPARSGSLVTAHYPSYRPVIIRVTIRVTDEVQFPHESLSESAMRPGSQHAQARTHPGWRSAADSLPTPVAQLRRPPELWAGECRQLALAVVAEEPAILFT